LTLSPARKIQGTIWGVYARGKLIEEARTLPRGMIDGD
jgi:hypothetical protein